MRFWRYGKTPKHTMENPIAGTPKRKAVCSNHIGDAKNNAASPHKHCVCGFSYTLYSSGFANKTCNKNGDEGHVPKFGDTSSKKLFANTIFHLLAS